MTVLVAEELATAICRDPDDDLVLGTAVAAHAECIITGDKDLLVLQKYLEIRILSPGEFLLLEAEET